MVNVEPLTFEEICVYINMYANVFLLDLVRKWVYLKVTIKNTI